MRYILSDQSFYESLRIAAMRGSLPPTHLRPAIADDTALSLEPVRTFACGPMTLMLADHTASWCLLEDHEAAVALDIQDTTSQALRTRWSLQKEHLDAFLIRLYQRGFLRLNGHAGIDPRLLAEGALFREGQLVEILVTQKCNLACLYCLADTGPDMPHLCPDAARLAVDAALRLPKTSPLTIQLSGGEPFVNFPLFKTLVTYIAKQASVCGRRVTICTQSNGALITDDIAVFLRDNNIQIGISIDGPASLNNRSRPLLGGGESHSRTVQGIRVLQQHGIPFGTILVLNRHNVHEPEAVADFFATLGITGIKVNPVNMIGHASRGWRGVAITAREYFAWLDRFIEHILDRHMRLQEANLAEYLKYLYLRMHNYRCMRANCGAGKSFFLVDAKADIYPCAHSAGLPEWRLGSIGDSGATLRRMGQRNAIVRQLRRRLVDQMEDTAGCPWRHFCEGGCAVNAFQGFGSILARDTLCEFYEMMYPKLLEKLAMNGERFQRLLDTTVGGGAARVESWELPVTTDLATATRVPKESFVSRHGVAVDDRSEGAVG